MHGGSAITAAVKREEFTVGKYEKKKESKTEQELSWQENAVLYLHDWVHLLFGILIVFLLLFRVFVVSGDSMYATLWDGDYVLLLSNLFYQNPEQGDIVVVSKKSFDNGSPIVKRVIAVEGQTVDIDFEQGIVYVDGEALVEPYINNLTTNREGMIFPLVVEDGCIFALGDNRQVSRDSRDPVIGQIDRREVLGKALILMLPGTNHDLYPRDFSRMGVVS